MFASYSEMFRKVAIWAGLYLIFVLWLVTMAWLIWGGFRIIGRFLHWAFS